MTEVEIAALKALADQASCPADEIVVVSSVGDPDPNIENEVILMLGTSVTCADVDVEKDLAKAANGARRTIWIWPENAEEAELPPSAAKYCYSAVPWSADKLRAVAADDDVICFETPAGELLPQIPTERNLCVEEKAKTK